MTIAHAPYPRIANTIETPANTIDIAGAMIMLPFELKCALHQRIWNARPRMQHHQS